MLSKFESQIPLALLPGGSSKVQQASGLWAATKASLIFRHIKACKWIQLQASRCQPPRLAKYFAIAKLQSSWAVWAYLPFLKCWRIRNDCLIVCSPCNQPEAGLTEGAEEAILLPTSRQENVLSLSGHRLHFAVPVLCPCLVSRAEAGLRGPFGMETIHKWFFEKVLFSPNFYSAWPNVGFTAPWWYGPLKWRQALWHTVFFASLLPIWWHCMPFLGG